MDISGDSFRRKVGSSMALRLISTASYPMHRSSAPQPTSYVVLQWWQLLWLQKGLWSPPPQISSLALSHSQTHMQIMWKLAKAQLDTEQRQNQADVSCSQQRWIYRAYKAKTSAFSLLLHLDCWVFWSYILNLLIAKSWRRFTGFSIEYSLALKMKENAYLWAER